MGARVAAVAVSLAGREVSTSPGFAPVTGSRSSVAGSDHENS